MFFLDGEDSEEVSGFKSSDQKPFLAKRGIKFRSTCELYSRILHTRRLCVVNGESEIEFINAESLFNEHKEMSTDLDS